jgi:uncharacterized protein YndB with AHSA1/START domain
MRVLKGLVIAVLLLLMALVGYGFTLPDQRRVERSTFIAAEPAAVFGVLNGFTQFNQWSPWADLDPTAIYTLDGPTAGVGAKASWSSTDPNVGAGSQEIVESVPNERIKLRLLFEGYELDSYSLYLLSPEGRGTRLTWAYETDFHGKLLNRYFGLLLERMIGRDYEKGLAKLKALVESRPQPE